MDLSDRLIFRRDLADPNADSSALSRAVRRGDLVRVKRGAYVATEVWTGLKPEQRHHAKVLAFARSYPGVVFSHHSAAVLLGLDLIGALPTRVEVLDQRASGGRSDPGLRRRCLRFAEHEVLELEFGGQTIRCTNVARTVCDLALVQPFSRALAPLDHTLRSGRTSLAELSEALDRRGMFAGCRRVAQTVASGDGRSQSAGESLSRGVIHECGFADPDLQVEHKDPRGGSFFTDFEWLDIAQIGEFDGKGKYFKDEYTGGRSAGEIVYDEKIREDCLRADGSGVTRWGWSQALERWPLQRLLLAAGVPLVRPPVGPTRSLRGRL